MLGVSARLLVERNGEADGQGQEEEVDRAHGDEGRFWWWWWRWRLGKERASGRDWALRIHSFGLIVASSDLTPGSCLS